MIGSKKKTITSFFRQKPTNPIFLIYFDQHHTGSCTQQMYRRLLFYNSIYEQILPLQGQIHITGVAEGNTLFILAHLSEIMDSLNTLRQIVGFDLFDDHQTTYPLISAKDGHYYGSENYVPHCKSFNCLSKHANIFNSSIRMKDYPRIALVKGNVVDTYPKFVKSNSPLISACSFISRHTKQKKQSLEAAWPYLARGSVIVSSTLGNYIVRCNACTYGYCWYILL